MRTIILASQSKSRKELLSQVGLRFRVEKPLVREERRLKGSCRDLVKRNALRKARDVARREGSGVVIAADTVVMAGGKLIGKPHTLRGAARMLKALSRKRQWVYTGLAVVDADTGRAFTACEETAIRMRPMSDASISWYFRKVSPLDKAGGFDVRGAGAVFVEQIEGCFYNVVGLPLARLARMLEKVGVDIL